MRCRAPAHQRAVADPPNPSSPRVRRTRRVIHRDAIDVDCRLSADVASRDVPSYCFRVTVPRVTPATPATADQPDPGTRPELNAVTLEDQLPVISPYLLDVGAIRA